jgi:hypothetical protein
MSTSDPRYVREYAEKMAAIGEARFLAQHRSSVLVGVGMIGDLADGVRDRRRTHKAVGSEEYVPVQSFLDRVWPLAPIDHPISDRYITLGYDAACDVVIPEYTLSSNHCAFSKYPPMKVADLGSLNGTRIDGQAIPSRKPVPLHDNAELTLGRLKLLYRSVDGFISMLKEFLEQR